MSNLRELHLPNNLLTGTIPETLSSLDLRVLNVQNNDLAGQILGYLGSWHNLSYLNIEKTLVTGTIPESIGTLKRLERLYLGQHLNGTLPVSFADLTNMVEFRISGNNLSGSIPSDFGQLSRLGTLSCLFLYPESVCFRVLFSPLYHYHAQRASCLTRLDLKAPF